MIKSKESIFKNIFRLHFICFLMLIYLGFAGYCPIYAQQDSNVSHRLSEDNMFTSELSNAGYGNLLGSEGSAIERILVSEAKVSINRNNQSKSIVGLIEYPRSGSVLSNKKPTLGADFQNIKSYVQGIKPALVFDKIDVTDKCDISEGYLFFRPDKELSVGEHVIELKLLFPDNKETISHSWVFVVSGPQTIKMAYPRPGTEIKQPRPVIGLNFDELSKQVDSDTVKIFVDGSEVTDKADLTEDYVFYTPEVNLKDGKHIVILKARSRNGVVMEPVVWDFNINVAGEDAVEAQEVIAESVESQKGATDSSIIEKRERSIASAIAETGRKKMIISKSSIFAESFTGKEPEKEIKVVYVQPKQVVGIEDKVEKKIDVSEIGTEKEDVELSAASGFMGTEYAMDLTSGYEKMDISGDATKSSQRARDAFIYKYGLRTETYLSSNEKSFLKEPTFYTTVRLEGTSDGDVTESFWDLKTFTGALEDDSNKFSFYDIRPKYTSYTLSGQRLLGGQYEYVEEDSKLNVFYGKFKKDRAGNRINIFGTRYSKKDEDDLEYGVQYVNTLLTKLRGGDRNKNELVGFDINKKYNYGETKAEWAHSSYSGVGQGIAYKVENTYKKRNKYLTTKFESVDSDFRTEGGFASKGLVEFNSSFQYQVSKRLSSVIGFKRRKFRDGGSKTVSVPFVVKYIPFKNRPSTTMELRNKTTKYDKGLTWKDTFTNEYNINHMIGTSKVTVGFKKERKERNDVSDENERLLNIAVKSPISPKADLTYKVMKLNNDIYYPETKNSYGLSYELTDWSDVKVSYETVNKFQPTLDRETKLLRYGMVNPENNTETSVEIRQNRFLEFVENYILAKFAIYY